MNSAPRVGMLSLEPWDAVWRRNQHLASRLVADRTIDSLVFVTPPAGGLALRARRSYPLDRIGVVTPPLLVPRRYGGYRMLGRWLRRAVSDVDALWVNDPVAGVAALSSGVPAVYDVTDDWRSMAQPPADRARLVAAEDELAGRASVVVCSEALRARWMTRYGLSPPVVTNGVDVEAIRSAAPRRLTGPAPHVVYVGTVHVNRLDVELVEQLARAPSIGTVHLVGPDHLDRRSRERLTNGGARLHGAVAAAEVPSWLVSSDVLICPHVVDDFTLSLDAIKSHEYLATDRPIVATRSSGFQTLSAPGLTVTDRSRFLDAVTAAAGAGSVDRTPPPSWDVRAAEFARVLRTALAAPGAPGPHR